MENKKVFNAITGMLMMILFHFTACDAVRDTLPNDVTTLGDIRIDEIDGESLEQVIRDSLAGEDVTIGDDTDNVFIVCCQTFEQWGVDTVYIEGDIFNNSDNRYVDVTHVIKVYDHKDEIIQLDRITYTEERFLWDFDLQPYQTYNYLVRFDGVLADINRVEITYASSVMAE